MMKCWRTLFENSRPVLVVREGGEEKAGVFLSTGKV